MIPTEVILLMRKEWRQLRASRQALATSTLMPLLFLFVIPQLLIVASISARGAPPDPDAAHLTFGLVGDVANDPTRAAVTMLPLFVGIAGLTVPTVVAIHAVVSERESRTFELLIALPVRVGWVLQAKLLTIVCLAVAVCGGFLLLSGIELLAFGIATPLEVAALILELFTAIAAGSAGALLVGFHSHDFRTAQNVSGAVLAPMILLSVGVSMLVGGGAVRPLALALLFACFAAGFGAHAARQTTFEKLLR